MTRKEAVRTIREGVVFTPNVDHLVLLQKDREFYDCYRRADWRLCDSQVLFFLSHLFHNSLPEAVNGADFFTEFYMYHKDDPDCRIFLLGAMNGVAEKAMERINERVQGSSKGSKSSGVQEGSKGSKSSRVQEGSKGSRVQEGSKGSGVQEGSKGSRVQEGLKSSRVQEGSKSSKVQESSNINYESNIRGVSSIPEGKDTLQTGLCDNEGGRVQVRQSICSTDTCFCGIGDGQYSRGVRETGEQGVCELPVYSKRVIRRIEESGDEGTRCELHNGRDLQSDVHGLQDSVHGNSEIHCQHPKVRLQGEQVQGLNIATLDPHPVEPVDPLEPHPVDPLNPLDPHPLSPLEPQGPVEPFEPLEPHPVEPLDPHPVAPLDPLDLHPVEPLDPQGPVELFEPFEPHPLDPLDLHPLSPLEPQGPVEPFEPIEPFEPVPGIIVGALSPSWEFEKKPAEIDSIIDIINASGANVVLVGVGAPKQEKWIMRYKDRMPGVKLWLALGATIDFEAGNVKRAPKWVRSIAMEWLYRMYCEPKRMFRRYICHDLVFFWYLLKQLLGVYKDPFK